MGGLQVDPVFAVANSSLKSGILLELVDWEVEVGLDLAASGAA